MQGKNRNHIKLAEFLLKENKFDWANWGITRLMNHKQKVQYAIFAATQVLYIFEKQFPKDDRPRKAIETIKLWLKNPAANAANAADAAAHAAHAAADAANAANAADAAHAAHAAAHAAHAAHAAANAAHAADAANIPKITQNKLKKKIIDYGLSLLNEA